MLAAAAATAHDTAVDLAVWGNFGQSAARCQRAIARAADLCASRALAARVACVTAELGATACDQAEVSRRIAGARQRASALVQAACTVEDLQTLRYVDLRDALNDLGDVCRGLETAATSAAYAPARFGDAIVATEGAARRCIEATARGSARLLRNATRARRFALDYIASTPWPAGAAVAAKEAVIARSTQRIARATELVRRRMLRACSAATFLDTYGTEVDGFLARIAARADCLAEAVYVQSAVRCPAPVCGDGMVTGGEQCDDGNDYDGDACTSTCQKTNCELFPTTYDLIQKAIFENHGCTEDACHGAARSGELDLRAGVSYQQLIDVPAATVDGMKRIEPGNDQASLLWINLAARTVPGVYRAPLRGMPLGLDPISPDELDALREWIVVGGAAREANIPSAANRLRACVPEPKPVKIEPLAPPPAGSGVQLHMPAWTLLPRSESEVCFSSYYDLSGAIPPQFLTEDGQHFRYKSVDIRQDPLSHHLIVDLHRGSEPANDPVWGVYRCRGGEREGEVCDPLDLPFCGGGQCATDPDPSAIACIGFGPQTGLSTLTRGGFAFAQATTAQFRFPDGVYDELPVRGVVLWNSHAFNVTSRAGTLEGWVNILFPEPGQQRFRQTQIFNASRIFLTDLSQIASPPALPAFQDMEICQVHEFGPAPGFGGSPLRAGETAHLFELSGHTHQRGTRFQIFRGRFRCSGGPNGGAPCSPFQPEMCPAAACVDDGGRDPQQALLYTNYVYNDPLVLRFAEPLLFSGAAPLADRTLTYCAHYDNGTPPNIQRVKRRSTSPPAGVLFDVVRVGGPCARDQTRCIGGPRHDQLCHGDHAFCDSSPDAGDGDCDACPLTGGFRTQDEMFVLFGNYWVTR